MCSCATSGSDIGLSPLKVFINNMEVMSFPQCIAHSKISKLCAHRVGCITYHRTNQYILGVKSPHDHESTKLGGLGPKSLLLTEANHTLLPS